MTMMEKRGKTTFHARRNAEKKPSCQPLVAGEEEDGEGVPEEEEVHHQHSFIVA